LVYLIAFDIRLSTTATVLLPPDRVIDPAAIESIA
jgi:hypothetical protein